MLLRKWDRLPPEMQNDQVRFYYDKLKKKGISLFFKRLFDIFFSLLLLLILSPTFLVLAIAIKIDSEGPVLYRQERITRYNKPFKIYKFRTMCINADKGSKITVEGDNRITRVGKFIRKCRLDEISQLINVLNGTMSFVGTRPEVPKFTKEYTPEMMATLLMPAGVTSLASIYFKDEAEMLKNERDTDKFYVEKILPEKMYYNLKSLEKFSFFRDLKIIFMTVLAVLGKNYKREAGQIKATDKNGTVEETEKPAIDKVSKTNKENEAGIAENKDR